MVLNYCGHCGAAARLQMRFCRQCGMDLSTGSTGELGSGSLAEEPNPGPKRTASGSLQTPPAEMPGPTEMRDSAPLTSQPVTAVPSQDTDSRREPPPTNGMGGNAWRSVKRSRNSLPDRQTPTASALAQASGLDGTSTFGSRIRALLVGVALLIVGIASVGYYRQSLRLLRFDNTERNLVTPEEQSLALIRVGKQALELGQYETAVGRFTEALALTPQHLPIYIMLGQSYQSAGQVDEALLAYAKLLRQDPHNLEARFEVAEIHRARGNWREAYQEYQRIIATNSQSLEAVAALAVIESQQSERPFEARRPDVAKNGPLTRLKMASVLPYVAGGERSLALSLAPPKGTSLAAPPTLWTEPVGDERADVRAMAESHKVIGRRYHNVREFHAAIHDFTIAQRLTPDDKDLFYLKGLAYRGLGLDAVAHELFKQCDSGQYAQVARNAAQMTAKAAKNESKRQEGQSGVEVGLPSRPTVNGLKEF